MRCVAVDWSGRERGAAEHIWIAEAEGGRLTFLENGRSAEQVVDWLTARRPDVVGLDFAFSFPAWFCAEREWRTGPEVWSGVAGEAGERLLTEERDPFWGRTRPRPPADSARPQLRDAERRIGTKSPFQIGGAGAVGTGSIRGMRHLLTLRAAGFAIWPFDPPRGPVVLEIYPRLMYREALRKSRWRERHRAFTAWFPGEPMLERAAGSEDAFDAAVSALVMSNEAEALRSLPDLSSGALEGVIWSPRNR